MTKKSSSSIDASIRLNDAIRSDLRGEADYEGRSPADSLIGEIQSSPPSRSLYSRAAVELARSEGTDTTGFWVVFERVVSLSELKSEALGDTLETILTDNSSITGEDRASIYSLLDTCGKPQSARKIIRDQILLKTAPLQWLDLIILRIPVLEDAQDLVLQAINRREFGLREFTQRLEEMRALGGTKLGNWLRTVRAALPQEETKGYDELVNEAFGLGNLNADSQSITVGEEQIQALADAFAARMGQLILKDLSAEGRPDARSKSAAGRTEREIHRDIPLKDDRGRGAALNIERIQQTKQLAKMSA